jgi:hypothetical protein
MYPLNDTALRINHKLCTQCLHDVLIYVGRHLLRILFITNRTSAATVEKLITSPCINYLLLNFDTTMKAVLSQCWYLTNVKCHTRQGNKIITCRNKLRWQSSFFSSCRNTSLKGYFIVRIGELLVCSSLIVVWLSLWSTVTENETCCSELFYLHCVPR